MKLSVDEFMEKPGAKGYLQFNSEYTSACKDQPAFSKEHSKAAFNLDYKYVTSWCETCPVGRMLIFRQDALKKKGSNKRLKEEFYNWDDYEIKVFYACTKTYQETEEPEDMEDKEAKAMVKAKVKAVWDKLLEELDEDGDCYRSILLHDKYREDNNFASVNCFESFYNSVLSNKYFSFQYEEEKMLFMLTNGTYKCVLSDKKKFLRLIYLLHQMEEEDRPKKNSGVFTDVASDFNFLFFTKDHMKTLVTLGKEAAKKKAATKKAPTRGKKKKAVPTTPATPEMADPTTPATPGVAARATDLDLRYDTGTPEDLRHRDADNRKKLMEITETLVRETKEAFDDRMNRLFGMSERVLTMVEDTVKLAREEQAIRRTANDRAFAILEDMHQDMFPKHKQIKE